MQGINPDGKLQMVRVDETGALIVSGMGGGGGSSVTNLSATVSPTGVVVASDTGTDASIPLADATNAGAMPPAAVQQLAGLGSASTAAAGDFAAAGHTHTPASINAATAAQGAKADAALPGTADALADLLEDAATTAPADLARIQSSVSKGRKKSAYLCFTGRSNAVDLTAAMFPANSSTSGLTIRQRYTLAQHADAVRVHIPHMGASAQSGVVVALGISETLGTYSVAPTANGSTGTATAPVSTLPVSPAGVALYPVGWGGAATPSQVAAPDIANLTPSWVSSDLMPVATVDRTDGGTYPVLDVVIYYPAGTQATLAFTGTDNSQWAMLGRADLNGGRALRAHAQAGEAISNPGAFTSTVSRPWHVPVIIEYHARGEVISVVANGDSIHDASTGVTTMVTDGFVWTACQSLQSLTGRPVEYCSLSAAGSSVLMQTKRANTLQGKIVPDLWIQQGNSVNGYGAVLSSRLYQHGYGAIGCAQALLENHVKPVPLVVTNMLPVTYAAKPWGATDATFRVTFNSSLPARAAADGYTVADISGPISGLTVSGQVEPVAGDVAADGIHPLTPTHKDKMAPALFTAMRTALSV